jgi:hypothetical protein
MIDRVGHHAAAAAQLDDRDAELLGVDGGEEAVLPGTDFPGRSDRARSIEVAPLGGNHRAELRHGSAAGNFGFQPGAGLLGRGGFSGGQELLRRQGIGQLRQVRRPSSIESLD